MSIDWIERAKSLQLDTRNFVNGRRSSVDHGRWLEKASPQDGRRLYKICVTDIQEVERAITSAKAASDDGRWSQLSMQRRKDVLARFASLVTDHSEEFALLECLDVGKPISDALRIDVPMAAAAIRFSAEALDKVHGKVYVSDSWNLSYQLYRPVGVVGAIVGWNFPLVLAATKIGPALAAGNSLVLKPSELTSLSAARLAELALVAGVPEGVLNVIHGDGMVGAALARHNDVDLLTFTGSTHTGKKLMIASGESNMKRLILECGGKAPNIVFDDISDIESVTDAIVARVFWNQGQVCTASSRLLVQDNIKDELLGLLIKRTSRLRPGDPLKAETTFGPVVSQGHRDKVTGYVRVGESEGARIAFQLDAPAPYPEGFYVSPVIFDDVTRQQRIAREEIFGPVLSIMSFHDEADAVRIANDTIYGLSAIVWTKDLGRAQRLTQGIKAGWIVVNATATVRGGPAEGVLSMGGLKQSGIGTEGGLEGLEEYMNKTAVQYQT
jgi:4-guanidinobutyraldehyde dehydrogenase/NAD-dependent aldehyde dehydrogenase